MLFRLFLLALVPVAELALLVAVGSRIGVVPTVALVLGTAAAGAWLARAQGLRTLRRLQEAVRAGRFPGDELLDGALVLAGGLLLLTPGFLTDLAGLCALLPPTRRMTTRLRRVPRRAAARILHRRLGLGRGQVRGASYRVG